ncbi:Pre-mRNA-processing factor 39 [Cercospora zeina]
MVRIRSSGSIINMLYERAADSVGLDFLAHPFWDKYLEFEERLDSHDRIFAILGRIVHLPLHQYARYFERYRAMAAQRPIADIAPEDVVVRFQAEIAQESDQKQRSPAEVERELRTRIDAYHLEIFQRTQTETTKRWTYEQNIKRPYYHVTELDEEQLDNWRKYLDFEETEGDYERTKFLYERCLVTCANYEEFWFRYARWTMAQTSITKEVRNEEVRIIYSRASCTYVAISQPNIRLHYARFEESIGKADTAIAIHEAILASAPGDLETTISLVNTHRRQYGIDAAVAVLNEHISNSEYSPSMIRGALVAELARLLWKVKGDVDEARKTFQKQQQWFSDSNDFWRAFFNFELNQPTSSEQEPSRHKRIRAVFDDIRHKARLPTGDLVEISGKYFDHLLDRGDSDAMQEYVELDIALNGPSNVAVAGKQKLGAKGTAQANGS